MMFRRQRREEVGVNLTPLIDVVFLLLIFFMVSTTFKKESHISLNLPEAGGEPLAVKNNQVEIVINANGEYAVNDKMLVNNKIDTLRAAINAVAQGNTGLPLIISADAVSPHQSVVTAMDAAGQLGFVNLSIATRQRDSDQ
ncbi:MAG: biopolymer transporter ExbD [Pseudomonadales bacterium]|nr:biopolymer transporter ExbD [Pseudomonadales bacterium]MCP5214560.1 biopolymer transporter ExbD [Pseudomonadales bacterium]MCP5303003.1 biopolymer transporter ExbD [Pseudomonadales bacterium]